MIQIYYAYTDILKGSDLDNLIAQLSLNDKLKLAGLKRNEDKLLLLTSLILLSKVLFENGYNDYKLCDLKYSNTGRPFFPDSPFDFNISHTDNCSAVVFSENGRVGIDIERIKDVDFADFENIFSEEVWNNIHSSEVKLRKFYYYWTLLESAVKADSRGLSLISAKKLVITNDQVIIDCKKLFSYHNDFSPTISCCITSDKKHETINSQELQSILS